MFKITCLNITCLKSYVRNHMFKITCSKSKIQNHMFEIKYWKSRVRNHIFKITSLRNHAIQNGVVLNHASKMAVVKKPQSFKVTLFETARCSRIESNVTVNVTTYKNTSVGSERSFVRNRAARSSRISSLGDAMFEPRGSNKGRRKWRWNRGIEASGRGYLVPVSWFLPDT